MSSQASVRQEGWENQVDNWILFSRKSFLIWRKWLLIWQHISLIETKLISILTKFICNLTKFISILSKTIPYSPKIRCECSCQPADILALPDPGSSILKEKEGDFCLLNIWLQFFCPKFTLFACPLLGSPFLKSVFCIWAGILRPTKWKFRIFQAQSCSSQRFPDFFIALPLYCDNISQYFWQRLRRARVNFALIRFIEILGPNFSILFSFLCLHKRPVDCDNFQPFLWWQRLRKARVNFAQNRLGILTTSNVLSTFQRTTGK